MKGSHTVKPRQGTALLECAVVLPILLMVVLGIVEFGRAIMTLDLVNNAARQGARVGAVAGRTNADIASAVDAALSRAKLPPRSAGTVLTIAVDGDAATDAGAAVRDDQIAVTVAVRVGSTTWLPVKWFMGPATRLSGTVVMRRE